MTQTSPPTEKMVSLHGRSIRVRPLNEMQLMLIAREARTLTRDNVPGGKKLEAMGTILDVFDSVVLEEADREHVKDLTIKGEFDLGDLVALIPQLSGNVVEEKPRARRGRPRKSVA